MKIAVVGLGYVGLPLALALSRKHEGVLGFDISQRRVEGLSTGVDSTRETSAEELSRSPLTYTSSLEDLKGFDVYIVAVPTPVDENNTPDLSALRNASETVGQVIDKGAIIVFESTVYPGVTEEFCGAIIENVSGLRSGEDFFLGYSPERINPGDKEHTLEKIVKVVAGQDEETAQKLTDLYGSVVEAGIHRAPSIKVAEAAKVIENTQRDLNIALMNELALIFDMMDIRTKDVLEAAATKWNFLKFTPGLVGGHCIGVDPYYLTTAAERLGYFPQVILAGRRINDQMGKYIAQRTVKLMVKAGFQIKDSRVGIFGVTFKEDVPDIRNSRVPDIIHELSEFGCEPVICDPYAEREETLNEYGIELSDQASVGKLDALILAVPHRDYVADAKALIQTHLDPHGIFVDVKSAVDPGVFENGQSYWCL